MLQCWFRVRSARLLRAVHNRLFSHRINAAGIQMLPSRLLEKVFPNHKHDPNNLELLSKIHDHLNTYGLLNIEAPRLPEVNLKVPNLDGASITEHFHNVAAKYSEPYLIALEALIRSEVPNIPSEFAFEVGWVRYSKDAKTFKRVDAPKGDAVVFDVETVVTEGGLPAMAVALTADHWYSWCSPALAEGRDHRVERLTPDLLIPMDKGCKKKHRVIIGHNVGFDRGYVKDQYSQQNSNTRFLDTLSLHVCVSGQTSEQKIMAMSVKKKSAAFEEHRKSKQMSGLEGRPAMKIKWLTVSSLNNLGDVHNLYCNQKLEKAARNTFVTGTSDEIRNDFQYLMKYCASDVLATRNVLCKLWPLFRERFPHPATLFGILETMTAYLPINANWRKYLEKSKRAYDELDSEIQRFLKQLATDTCAKMENDAYKSDPWLWDLDWSLQKSTESTKPKWFRDLCDKNDQEDSKASEYDSGVWSSSLRKRAIPKLLKITWDGYPVHYHSSLGWGYLVPSATETEDETFSDPFERIVAAETRSDTSGRDFPLETYRGIIDDFRKQQKPSIEQAAGSEDAEEKFSELEDFSKLDNDWQEVKQDSKVFSTGTKTESKRSSSVELSYDIGLRGVKFKKLRNKPGSSYNVGSPLSRSMIDRHWSQELSSQIFNEIEGLFEMARNTSYWKMIRDGISEQVAVWTSEDQGAILPRIVPAGTVHRKPLDRTWSTTRSASIDRVGSEFKAMVQAPEGFHFVGCLAESKELWIAALLGDAEFAQMHGATALGWRVIQEKLLPDVGLHKHTASIVGCTEKQAEALDLFRLHGGGRTLLRKLLADLKSNLTAEEAQLTINQLVKITKGERAWPETRAEPTSQRALGPYRRSLLFADGEQLTQMKLWFGGSESHTFNRMEKIVTSSLPSTPFLEARVSRALEPRFVFNKYVSVRMNWLIQSSAVDFLHLILLSTRHLFDEFNIKGRLVLPVNDDIRYMVSSKHRYKAALALHISNLYARSFFAERLGMDDLPYSVAFCPAVNVDEVLRRDVTDDCVTPSNPHGLLKTYGIAPGESLNIYETLEKLARRP